MIEINKSTCVGCEACVNICPKNSIRMVQDNEGFFYPEIDESTCVNCGLCNRVCVAEQPLKSDEKTEICYAAYAKSEEIRSASTSGGVFSLLAEYVIKNNGTVYGASYDSNDNSVHHIRIDCIDELPRLRSSKYIQSHIDNSYSLARQDLEDGRLVLFSATGCQADGLLKFLNKQYENLILVDVACHGVPSEGVWKKYLNYLNFNKPASVNFRNKKTGWEQSSLIITDGEKTYSKTYYNDIFVSLFLADIILRKSCFNCPSKSLNRGSDLTIADFWGIKNVDGDMFNKNGVSLVLINSEKGKRVFDIISKETVFKEESLEEALKYNPSIISSSEPHKARNNFFEDLNKTDNPDFSRLYDKYCVFFGKSLYRKAIIKAKHIIKRILNK